MVRPIVTLAFAATVAVAACGGGGEAPGQPLVSASLAGEYQGQPFTPTFGFVAPYQQTNLIGLGDGPLNCASPQQNDPPSGTNALLSLPTLAVGSYSSILVQIMQNKGNFYGTGSNTGRVVITAVTDTSVAGSVEYNYTDDQNRTYGISGTFEVTRCAN
jgi:hypothetical protein